MAVQKRFKKSIPGLLILLSAWVVFALGCMRMRISDSEAKKEFAANGVNLHTNTVVIHDFKLHYAKTGNDTLPTLFFVHGSPGSWDAFKVYMQDKDLLSRYRMFSIDRPGFGYSQFGDARSLPEQAAIINPFLQQIQNGKPIYIIGHSLGGPVAVTLVADNPGMFKAMVLLAASVDPAEEAPERWRGFVHNSPLKYFLPGAFKPSNDELWFFKKDVHQMAAALAAVQCDVYIVHGDKDKFVPVGNAAFAKRMLVNARSVSTTILKGAPHFIPWEPWYKDVKAVLLQLQ